MEGGTHRDRQEHIVRIQEKQKEGGRSEEGVRREVEGAGGRGRWITAG